MANVLLLRAPTTDGPDKYESALSNLEYHPVSIPVLETVLVNLGDLQDLVKSGPNFLKVSGVIITSARSSEAWRDVVQRLVSAEAVVAGTCQYYQYTRALLRYAIDWTATPFYVVGQATATALEQISEVAGNTALAPRDIRGANETGNAEKLAHFILQDLTEDGTPRKLLYLTGDKNRDTLPTILQDGGVNLQPLQVYRTQGSSTFASELQSVLDSIPNRECRLHVAAVHTYLKSLPM